MGEVEEEVEGLNSTTPSSSFEMIQGTYLISVLSYLGLKSRLVRHVVSLAMPC